MAFLHPARLLTALAFAFLSAFALANVTVLSDATQLHELRPGASFDGSVTVRNLGDDVTSVRTYLTDYSFQADGTTRFDEAGSNRRSNAAWYEILGPSTYDLQPGAEATIVYRGSVPSDGTLSGTYWSVLMIEEAPAAVGDDAEQGDAAVGVQVVNRRAVQIVTDLENGSAPALTFENPTLGRAHGTSVLSVDIGNTGTEYARPTTSIEIFDHDGAPVSAFEGVQKRLYPGTSARFEFTLEGLSAGEYQAVVIADAGEDHVFGVRYTLTLTNDE